MSYFGNFSDPLSPNQNPSELEIQPHVILVRRLLTNLNSVKLSVGDLEVQRLDTNAGVWCPLWQGGTTNYTSKLVWN